MARRKEAYGLKVGDIVTWTPAPTTKAQRTSGRGKVTGITADLSIVVVDMGTKMQVTFANPRKLTVWTPPTSVEDIDRLLDGGA